MAAPVPLSIEVATIATLLGLPVATSLGWLLARRDFPGKRVLGTLLLLPLVLPPVVTGLLLLRVFAHDAPVGRALAAIGVSVPFSTAGAVVAAFVVGLPLYVLSVRGAIEAVDHRYEDLSATLGAKPWATTWRVTLPLAMPGIAAGALLAFARALGEFGATIVLAGNVEGETRTIALAVYTLLDAPGGEAASLRLVAASVTLSAAALVGYEALGRWQRRRLEVELGR